MTSPGSCWDETADKSIRSLLRKSNPRAIRRTPRDPCLHCAATLGMMSGNPNRLFCSRQGTIAMKHVVWAFLCVVVSQLPAQEVERDIPYVEKGLERHVLDVY